MKESMFLKYILIIIMLVLIFPYSAMAGFGDFDFVNSESSVVNQISVSASSGGNNVGEGEVVQGKTRAEVEIKTIVNGEVLVDEKIKDEGSEARVELESQVVSDGDESKTGIKLKNKTEEEMVVKSFSVEKAELAEPKSYPGKENAEIATAQEEEFAAICSKPDPLEEVESECGDGVEQTGKLMAILIFVKNILESFKNNISIFV